MSNDKVFTASDDGVLAMWVLSTQNFEVPKWNAGGHNHGIISIDACEDLGLIASAEAGGLIILREIHNGKLVRIIETNKIGRASCRERGSPPV